MQRVRRSICSSFRRPTIPTLRPACSSRSQHSFTQQTPRYSGSHRVGRACRPESTCRKDHGYPERARRACNDGLSGSARVDGYGVAGTVMCLNMATSDGRPRSDSYSRRIGDYVRPPAPLRLDGSMSWYAKTGYENEDVLHALPTGVEIDVEVVPEPGNRHDQTAPALDIDKTRVGYVPRWVSARLFPAVVAANAAGLQCRRGRRCTPSGRDGEN